MTDIPFSNHIARLEKLFGKTIVLHRQKRLQEIYENTEESWNENLERLKRKQIEYLLIAESPPWSENGTIRYFYNRIESKYHKSIWNAFYPKIFIPSDREKSYEMLADKNFLLVDTIPYSMKYSASHRRSSSYYEILLSSVPWWASKLANENLLLSKKVKVALAFKLNGNAIVKATGGQLKLRNNQVITLTEGLIAADSSGYTNSRTLRKLYGL